MKKTVIAAGASVALAAMPMFGVFAETQPITRENFVDNFAFTLERQCTINRLVDSNDGGHPSGTWNPNGTQTEDKIAITLTAGQASDLGSSRFNVICNGTSGYQVRAVANNLTNAQNDVIAISNTPITGNTASVSSWTAQSSATNGYVTSTSTATPTVVASSEDPTPNNGTPFTMTYRVGVQDGQASGIYQGSITYTLYDMTDTPAQP